RPVITQL
ncbi:hypothetical protein VTH82DRAFT_6898, partial [Thermothelomyces myriococcoides]